MKRLEWKTMLAGQTALLTVQRRSAKHCAAYSYSGWHAQIKKMSVQFSFILLGMNHMHKDFTWGPFRLEKSASAPFSFAYIHIYMYIYLYIHVHVELFWYQYWLWSIYPLRIQNNLEWYQEFNGFNVMHASCASGLPKSGLHPNEDSFNPKILPGIV